MNTFSLVQINHFHKAHQEFDPRTEHPKPCAECGKEGPLRSERVQDPIGNQHEDCKKAIAVNSRKQCINDVEGPLPAWNIVHLDGKAENEIGRASCRERV